MTQGDLESMLRSLKKAVIEREMSAEMTEHLGGDPGQAKPDGQRNHRKGADLKTVLTDDGPVRIEVPRDRHDSIEPQIIGKHERRFTGFDRKIVAWQSRPLEAMYPVVFFDALRLKTRDDAVVRNQVVCLALGVLDAFATGPWGAKYLTIVQSWRRA